jgi:hypothetical protein
MPNYHIDGTDTNTDNTTMGYISAHATVPRRTKIFDAMIGSRVAPVDQACGYEFNRITAENGTPGGTLLTPRPHDPADAAATSKPRSAPTGEPTITAGEIVLYIPLHQRPTMRWVAAKEGCELVTPAVADDGLAIVADTPTTAFAMIWGMDFNE